MVLSIKFITSDSNEALFFRRNHFVFSEEENKQNTCAMICSTWIQLKVKKKSTFLAIHILLRKNILCLLKKIKIILIHWYAVHEYNFKEKKEIFWQFKFSLQYDNRNVWTTQSYFVCISIIVMSRQHYNMQYMHAISSKRSAFLATQILLALR